MRIPIRTKLAGAMLLPLLALVAVVVYEVGRANDRADEAASETRLASAAVGPNSLISNLQNERNFTGARELSLEGAVDLPVESVEEARAATDAAVVELQDFVDSQGGDLAGVFDAGLAAVDTELASVRTAVDESTLERGLGNQPFADDVFTRYTTIIRVLMDDTRGIALEVDDADLRTGVELVGLATQAYETGSNVVRSTLLFSITGDNGPEARIEVARLNAVNDATDVEMLNRSVGPYEGLPEEHLIDPEQQAQDELLKQFENTGAVELEQLMGGVRATEEAGTLALRADVADALDAEGASILDDANAQKRNVLLFGIATVLAALAITVVASQSITNPLRSLTRQARAMASDRLPDAVQQVLDTPLGEDVVVPEVPPIQVKTRDEVADVAAALNTVQGSALDLAVEQAALRRNIADSFVNMGRRNQNLLDRQLDFITDLERQEQEPERLEGLFRLDHLATRMRRNAESLLRLAGGGSDTGSTWTGPVPMVDVVRGALGEVEDYQRVDVRALQAATVSGTAGADLAHALAELVENALQFSPPHERVEVRGRRADNGGYVLAVIDQGVGMTEDQLEVANRRLAGEESFTVAPSRYLGHYVAGYLAATHGIRIELRSTAAGGITARLDIPPALLVPDSDSSTYSSLDEAPAPPLATVPDAPAEPAPVASYPAPTEAAGAEAPAAPVAEPFHQPMAMPSSAPPVERPVVEEQAPVARTTDGGGLARRSDAGPPVAAAPSAPPAPAPAPTASPAGPNGDAQTVTGGLTQGGLARRVRGANAPSATNVAAAFGGGEAVASSADSSADGVASFLSAFSGGVERGLSEAHREEEEQ